MLAALAARPVCINPKLAVRYLNVSIILNFRHHIKRGKSGMTPLVGVKRAYPDKAMNATLGLHVAVGIGTVHGKGDAPDACFFTGSIIHDFDLKTVIFAVAPIHPEQHISPIAGFRASCAGMKSQIRILHVEPAAKQGLDFKLLEYRLGLVESRIGFFQGLIAMGFVGFTAGKFQHQSDILNCSIERRKRFEYGALLVCLAYDFLCFVLSIPEGG